VVPVSSPTLVLPVVSTLVSGPSLVSASPDCPWLELPGLVEALEVGALSLPVEEVASVSPDAVSLEEGSLEQPTSARRKTKDARDTAT